MADRRLAAKNQDRSAAEIDVLTGTPIMIDPEMDATGRQMPMVSLPCLVYARNCRKMESAGLNRTTSHYKLTLPSGRKILHEDLHSPLA